MKHQLVAQIRYNEMTASGLLRQPAFLGLGDDKKASDVRLEPETSLRALERALDFPGSKDCNSLSKTSW